eukprot:TRINITY_DN1015_c0_g1_i2.p2 TRINITY_DN1015_c0_g1~~TRINITY_DN1015_c0_g1_i2.p2  ORF type:complete len:289 (+),score=97.85 TRINITY_DN1015_c0_g1_i2:82-948(+)
MSGPVVPIGGEPARQLKARGGARGKFVIRTRAMRLHPSDAAPDPKRPKRWESSVAAQCTDPAVAQQRSYEGVDNLISTNIPKVHKIIEHADEKLADENNRIPQDELHDVRRGGQLLAEWLNAKREELSTCASETCPLGFAEVAEKTKEFFEMAQGVFDYRNPNPNPNQRPVKRRAEQESPAEGEAPVRKAARQSSGSDSSRRHADGGGSSQPLVWELLVSSASPPEMRLSAAPGTLERPASGPPSRDLPSAAGPSTAGPSKTKARPGRVLPTLMGAGEGEEEDDVDMA